MESECYHVLCIKFVNHVMGIQFIKHTLTDGLKSILIGDDYFIRNTVRLYINYSK